MYAVGWPSLLKSRQSPSQSRSTAGIGFDGAGRDGVRMIFELRKRLVHGGEYISLRRSLQFIEPAK